MHIIKSIPLMFFLMCSSLWANGSQDYLLSLSWSPTYCLTNPRAEKTTQCNIHKKYGLIAHGLWEQGENGKRPDFFCQKENSEVPAQVIEKIFPIMPSVGLINHEWKKHGTCSHETAREYFGQIQSLYKQYNIKGIYPFQQEKMRLVTSDEVKQEILQKTEILQEDQFMFSCSGRFLKEVRICLNSQLEPRKCTVPERKGQCRLKNIYVPYL